MKRTSYEAPHYSSLLHPPASSSLIGSNVLLNHPLLKRPESVFFS